MYTRLQHEDTSRDLFDHMVKENGLMPEFEDYDLYEQDLVFIKKLITGIRPKPDSKVRQ